MQFLRFLKIFTRWYWNLAWITFGVAALLQLLTIKPFGPDIGMSHDGRIILQTVGLLIGAVAAGWCCWVCPLYAVRDFPQGLSGIPKLWVLGMKWMLWAPTMSLLATIATVLTTQATGPVYVGFDTIPVIEHTYAYQAVVLLVPAVPCAILLSPRLRQTAQAAADSHALCFDCGYDLSHSTRPACPECGREYAFDPAEA